MKNIKWFSITKAFRENVLTEALITLDNSIELSVLFRRIGWRIISACFTREVKLSSRLRFLGMYLQHILRLRRIYGSKFVVIYLKACQLAVQKFLAGSPLSSLKEVGGDYPFPRLASGLPKVIPLYDRRLIRGGSASVIRYWLTLFSLYRVLKIPGELKLSTITDECSVSLDQVEEVGRELSAIAGNFRHYVPKPNSENRLLLLESASSTSSVSWTGLFKDPFYLRLHGLDGPLLKIMDCLDLKRLRLQWDLIVLLQELRRDIDIPSLHKVDGGSVDVGQLSIKEEAAGKLRVFALVDVWTQSVLQPIHDSLFSFLRNLPNDATFDQLESVNRCFEKVKISGKSFGYDLSAATDRLPISIQVQVLGSFFGMDLACAWRDLLINREYVLRSKQYGDARVKYAVGQPMGALSSWAMLAVTHHLIVQFAARQTYSAMNTVWYDGYELLGDDIVIFDERVADSYLDIMSKLGVSINLSKSVISSKPCFEFAKVTGYYGKDVSALSWKSFISQNTWMGRSNILFSLLKRQLQISNWVSWAERFTRHTRKAGKLNSLNLLAIWTMFSNSGMVSLETVLRSLHSKNVFRRNHRSLLLNANNDFVINCISNIVRGQSLPNVKPSYTWRVELDWIKLSICKPIMVHKSRFDPIKVAGDLAEQMVRRLVPGAPIEKSIYDFDYGQLDTTYDQALNAFWLGWYMDFKDKLLSLDSGIPGSKIIDMTIDEISSETDLVDRTNELIDIFSRASAKEGCNKVRSLVRPSPLRILKLYVNGSRNRPSWTFPGANTEREFTRVPVKQALLPKRGSR